MATSWQRKFARAQHHLDGLAPLVTEFMAAEPYVAVEQINNQDRSASGFQSVSHTFIGRVRDKPPSTWSPVIGDCLNNMRSSLDHLAWGLAGSRGGKTAFPLFSQSGNYKTLTPERHLRYVRKDAHALIEELQPYNHVDGPKAHVLRTLDRLTNDDKHRELVGTEIGIAHIHINDPVGQMAKGDVLEFEFEPVDRLFEDEAVLARYHSSNPNVYVPMEFTFDVALDPEGPAGGWPLLSCLGSLSFATWLVLREFERRFFASIEPTPFPFEDAQLIAV